MNDKQRQFLKRLKKFYHYSDYEFARALGISRSSLMYIYNGKRDMSVDEVNIVCALFNININEFMNGEAVVTITKNI